jgi:hypothetical protein
LTVNGALQGILAKTNKGGLKAAFFSLLKIGMRQQIVGTPKTAVISRKYGSPSSNPHNLCHVFRHCLYYPGHPRI